MISSGTDEYITRIVREYSAALFRIAYSVLHNRADAEDMVQEAFIRLMTARPKFADSEHEKAWLIRVTINLSRNRLKANARFAGETVNQAEAPQDESHGDVLEAVLSLPEKYSTVIHLYYYEGCSIAQIASILKIPAATVGTRLSRGRAALRAKLEGDYFDGH